MHPKPKRGQTNQSNQQLNTEGDLQQHGNDKDAPLSAESLK